MSIQTPATTTTTNITATATATDSKGKATLTLHGAANEWSETGKRAAKANYVVLHTNLPDTRTVEGGWQESNVGYQWASLHGTLAAAQKVAATDGGPSRDGVTRFWDTQVIAVTRAEVTPAETPDQIIARINAKAAAAVGVDLTVVTAEYTAYLIPATNHWTLTPDNCDVEAPGITYFCTREPGHDGDHAAHRSDGTQVARWAAEVAPEAPALKVGDFAYFGPQLAFGKVFSVAHIGDVVSYGYTDIAGTNQQYNVAPAALVLVPQVYVPEEQSLALAYWDAVRAYRALITAKDSAYQANRKVELGPLEGLAIQTWSTLTQAADAIYATVNDLGNATLVSAGA